MPDIKQKDSTFSISSFVFALGIFVKIGQIYFKEVNKKYL